MDNTDLDQNDKYSKNSYVKLSPLGTQEYKKLQMNAIKQFGFWMFIGTLGGIVISKFVKTTYQKKKSPAQIRRLEIGSFIFCVTILSYHGYKLSKFHFIKGKKKLLANSENTLNEPNHEQKVVHDFIINISQSFYNEKIKILMMRAISKDIQKSHKNPFKQIQISFSIYSLCSLFMLFNKNSSSQ